MTTNEVFFECPEGLDVGEWWKAHHDNKEAILGYAADIMKELKEDDDDDDDDEDDDSSDGTSEDSWTYNNYICPLWKVSHMHRDDKDVVKAAIATYVHDDEDDSSHSLRHEVLLRWAGEKCRDDKDLVMYAIGYDYRSMEYASSRLRDDEDVVIFAVSRNCSSVRYASDRLLSNEDFILQLVTSYEDVEPRQWNPDYEGVMNHLPSIYRDNQDVVLRCARTNGLVLQVCSNRLRDQSNIVLAAIQSNGIAMMYASDALKDDKRFVLTAVHYEGHILTYVSERLQRDAQVAAVAVSNWENVRFWRNLQPSIQKNFDVAFAYVSNNEVDFSDIYSSKLHPRGDFPLYYLNDELGSDRRIVLAAVSKDPRNFWYVHKKDPEVILTIVQSIFSNRDCLEVVSPREYDADMVGLIDFIDELHDLYEDLAGNKLTYGSIQTNYHPCSKSATARDSHNDPEVWLQSQWEKVWLVTKINPNFKEGEPGNDFDWTSIQKMITSYIGPEQIAVRYKKIKDCEICSNVLSGICWTVRFLLSDD